MRGPILHAVIDTNVLFEGLTRRGGACGWIVEAWLSGWFRACVSNALAYEYAEVLASKLAERRWLETRPVLRSLLEMAQYVPVHFSWRPASPDPADEHVVDCAMNAKARLVTLNVRDFRSAEESLGLIVDTPKDFVAFLADALGLGEREAPEE